MSTQFIQFTSIISKFFIVLNRSLLVRKLIATEQNPTAVAKSENDKIKLLLHDTLTINKACSKLTIIPMKHTCSKSTTIKTTGKYLLTLF